MYQIKPYEVNIKLNTTASSLSSVFIIFKNFFYLYNLLAPMNGRKKHFFCDFTKSFNKVLNYEHTFNLLKRFQHPPGRFKDHIKYIYILFINIII